MALRRFQLDARSSTIRARRRVPPPGPVSFRHRVLGPRCPFPPLAFLPCTAARLEGLRFRICVQPEPRGVASAPFPQPGSFVQSAPTWPLPVGHCACFWGYEGDPCSRCWSPRERNHYTNDCITGDSVALPQDFVNLPPNSPQRTSIHSAGRKRGGGKDILGLPWVAGRWRRVEESAGTSRCHRASPKRKLTRVG